MLVVFMVWVDNLKLVASSKKESEREIGGGGSQERDRKREREGGRERQREREVDSYFQATLDTVARLIYS